MDGLKSIHFFIIDGFNKFTCLWIEWMTAKCIYLSPYAKRLGYKYFNSAIKLSPHNPNLKIC